MEKLIKETTLKYYPEGSISSISHANSRIIITIQNELENKELANKLKAELSSFEGVKKVNIIYSEQGTTDFARCSGYVESKKCQKNYCRRFG